jgi:hypothetical protein
MPTSKKKTKNTRSRRKQGIVWTSFFYAILYVIIGFGILFPIWSWMLQIIFDSRIGGGGFLPNHPHKKPYCPERPGESCIGEDKDTDEHMDKTWLWRQIWKYIYSSKVAKMVVSDATALGSVELTSVKNLEKIENKSAAVVGEYAQLEAARVSKIDAAVNLEKERRSSVRRGMTGGANKYASEILDETMQTWNTSTKSQDFITRKNNLMCCKDFMGAEDDKTELECGDKENEKKFPNIPPFNWLVPKKFGWPYTWLYNDVTAKSDPDVRAGSPPKCYKEMSKDNTAFNWKDKKNSTFWYYLKAWFARTQQISWSMNRGILKNILGWFRFYIHDDLSASAINKRLTKFIAKMKQPPNEKKEVDASLIEAFEKIKKNFETIFETKGMCVDPIKVLLNVMDPYLRKGKNGSPNIFLDFYIGAIEPEKLTGNKYWARFITTLLMPLIGIIIIVVSHFAAMIGTPYAAYNKYGGLLAIIPTILVMYFNMLAQPLMAFIYLCFGACGTRNRSNECPYDTGYYQFKRNMTVYTPLILKISAAFLISVLGTTLVNGGLWWGTLISLIVPATFLYYVIKFLICGLYEKKGVLYGLHALMLVGFVIWVFSISLGD